MIIDAKDLILGRMATIAAKRALLGEDVSIINCEQAVITGKKDNIFAERKVQMGMGHHIKGPFYYREPDFFVKQSVRGMLPNKGERGPSAIKRVMCYVGVPESLKGQNPNTIPEAHISNSKAGEYVTVGSICRLQGAKRIKGAQ